MLNEKPSANIFRHGKGFWAITTCLFVVAVALRWVRLDLMTFRYDQAAVAYRAMEVFNSGLVSTGIINSLGFHNGPGYIWTLLPAFFVSPDPRWAAGLHGLLASSMVFPLALIGRRYRHDALLWLPVIIAAVFPVSVFAGRNLWAQYLLPAVAAWALWALDGAVNSKGDLGKRIWLGGAALALLAWGTSIHFSAGILLIICAGFLLAAFRDHLRQLIFAALPAFFICLTMIPSLLDWWRRKVNPQPKPYFAEEYEAILPDPLPWYARVPDSVGYVFNNSAIEALYGIQTYMGELMAQVVSAFDTVILVILCGSGLYALWVLLRKNSGGEDSGSRKLATLLVAWIVIPAVVGGLLVKRVNAGYFPGSLPAGWLLVLLLPAAPAKLKLTVRGLMVSVCLCGIAISGFFITLIARHTFVPGAYYNTYGRQLEAVKYLASQGIPQNRVIHLSGDWFQHSYKYIHKYIEKPATPAEGFALMEDKKVRPDQPKRVEVFWSLGPVEVGDIGIKIMASRGAAETFKWNYYELPPE